MEKDGHNIYKHHDFHLHKSFQLYTKFEYLNFNRSGVICNRNFDWKEKCTNKGTDKQRVADSFLHSANCHTQALYQI